MHNFFPSKYWQPKLYTNKMANLKTQNCFAETETGTQNSFLFLRPKVGTILRPTSALKIDSMNQMLANNVIRKSCLCIPFNYCICDE